MKPATLPAPKITTRTWLMIVAGVAIVQRALMWALYPVVTLGDTGSYRRSAQAILGGWVKYDGTRTPGYPAFMALAGPDGQVYIAQLLLGLATTLLFFYIGWKITGRAWFGAVIALLHTLNAGQFFFEANLMTETLATFWLALACAGMAFLLTEPVRDGTFLPFSGNRRSWMWLATALITGLAAALATLTRPLFVFLPFWVALFLVLFWHPVDLKTRAVVAAAALVPALILVGLWVGFIHDRFHAWSLSAMQGFHLIQHTGEFFEYVPDQYAAVRDTYLKYRAVHVAKYGTQVNTIWDAIPELEKVSGESFYGLSRLIQKISIQLIIAHPLLYLRNVGLGWLWFWKVPVYWSPEAVTGPMALVALRGLVLLERALLFGANLVFIAGSLGAVIFKKLRARLNMTPFVWFIVGAIWVASVLQTLLDHGDNPRFSVPMQTSIVLVVLYWLLISGRPGGPMRDLRWCAPAGLALGALLALLSGGAWWIGWLGYSALLVPGLWALAALWRWCGSGKRLGLIITVAFLLRLACGTALTLLLPTFGHDNPEQNAGYVFYDAYRRDTQAWELAHSDGPLLGSFLKRGFITDQYGGLLAASFLLYKGLSPNFHRQMLVIVLGSLVAAIGIPLVWRAGVEMAPHWTRPNSQNSGGNAPPHLPPGSANSGGRWFAFAAAWIMAVYPESVLQGASQMREPFLITFTTFTLWGFLAVRRLHRRSGWFWLAGGLLGLLLFSPGIALANLVILGGWILLESGRRWVSWLLAGGLGLIFIVALALLAGSWRQVAGGHGTLDILTNWLQLTLRWNLYALDRSSGMVQYLFAHMPGGLRLPFIGSYGMLQPVLPSALIEPTVPLWRLVGTLRAAGWYVLLPFLVCGVIAALKTDDPAQRRLWLWLVASVWVWILISALRGGGDQWDNPRYRVILLPWQALVAAYAMAFWRERRGRWLGRIVALEVLFLVTFTVWYGGRYHGLPLMNFWSYVLLVLAVGITGVAVDILVERRNKRVPD